MCFNYKVCETCSQNLNKCEYHNMSLLQYCDANDIPFEFRKGGLQIYIYIKNADAEELKKEIERTNNRLKETRKEVMVVE